MKNRIQQALTIGALLFGLAFCSAEAQTNYGQRGATRQLSVGAAFAGGASMVFSPPGGSKVKPIFAYRATAEMAYPLTPVISAELGLGLDSKGYRFHAADFPDIGADRRINYFAVTPGFTFSAFYIGLNLGFPLSASYSNDGSLTEFSDRDIDNLTTLIEPRLGAVIPLLDDETGWLGLSIIAGASATEMQDGDDTVAGIFSGNDEADYHITSLHLGLTYQFAIPGTQRK